MIGYEGQLIGQHVRSRFTARHRHDGLTENRSIFIYVPGCVYEGAACILNVGDRKNELERNISFVTATTGSSWKIGGKNTYNVDALVGSPWGSTFQVRGSKVRALFLFRNLLCAVVVSAVRCTGRGTALIMKGRPVVRATVVRS